MLTRRAAALCAVCALASASGVRAQIQPLAVWGTGPNDVWAVGATLEPLHFSGTSWEKVPLGGTDLGALYAVWGSGPADVFVGGEIAGAGAILRWDGRAWTDVPLPMPFFATSLALRGDEVLVAGYVNPDEAPGSDRTPGVLARLRAGRWSLSGWTRQGVTDPAVASAQWERVLAAGDTIYLWGTLPDGKTPIVVSSGGAWTQLPTPEGEVQSFAIALAFLTGDRSLLALLSGGVGYGRLAEGRWSLVRPPDRYSPPPGMSPDELLRQTLAWSEVEDARAAWGPSAGDFFLLTRAGRIVHVQGGSPAIVYDATCADPDIAARSPICRMLRRP
ncbi:MAG: hypothetical protein AAB409_03585 [Gemmatimonadota bacterium]